MFFESISHALQINCSYTVLNYLLLVRYPQQISALFNFTKVHKIKYKNSTGCKRIVTDYTINSESKSDSITAHQLAFHLPYFFVFDNFIKNLYVKTFIVQLHGAAYIPLIVFVLHFLILVVYHISYFIFFVLPY